MSWSIEFGRFWQNALLDRFKNRGFSNRFKTPLDRSVRSFGERNELESARPTDTENFQNDGPCYYGRSPTDFLAQLPGPWFLDVSENRDFSKYPRIRPFVSLVTLCHQNGWLWTLTVDILKMTGHVMIDQNRPNFTILCLGYSPCF